MVSVQVLRASLEPASEGGVMLTQNHSSGNWRFQCSRCHCLEGPAKPDPIEAIYGALREGACFVHAARFLGTELMCKECVGDERRSMELGGDFFEAWGLKKEENDK